MQPGRSLTHDEESRSQNRALRDAAAASGPGDDVDRKLQSLSCTVRWGDFVKLLTGFGLHRKHGTSF